MEIVLTVHWKGRAVILHEIIKFCRLLYNLVKIGFPLIRNILTLLAIYTIKNFLSKSIYIYNSIYSNGKEGNTLNELS